MQQQTFAFLDGGGYYAYHHASCSRKIPNKTTVVEVAGILREKHMLSAPHATKPQTNHHHPTDQIPQNRSESQPAGVMCAAAQVMDLCGRWR